MPFADCATPHVFKLQLPSEHAVWIKDEASVHPLWGGNKWRKLIGHFNAYQQAQYNGIISFGGAWSNHLYALSHICAHVKIPLRMIIRGERPATLSVTLAESEQLGTELVFVSRAAYKKYVSEPEVLQSLHPNWYGVPEGGGGAPGLEGCIALGREVPDFITDVVVAAGTGTTAHGIRLGLSPRVRLHVVSALKAGPYFLHFLQAYPNTKVYHQAHQGGYARINTLIIDTIQHMASHGRLLLDPVYTVKAWLQMQQLLEETEPNKRNWMFIHTGGTQGLRGYPALASYYKRD